MLLWNWWGRLHRGRRDRVERKAVRLPVRRGRRGTAGRSLYLVGGIAVAYQDAGVEDGRDGVRNRRLALLQVVAPRYSFVLLACVLHRSACDMGGVRPKDLRLRHIDGRRGVPHPYRMRSWRSRSYVPSEQKGERGIDVEDETKSGLKGCDSSSRFDNPRQRNLGRHVRIARTGKRLVGGEASVVQVVIEDAGTTSRPKATNIIAMPPNPKAI